MSFDKPRKKIAMQGCFGSIYVVRSLAGSMRRIVGCARLAAIAVCCCGFSLAGHSAVAQGFRELAPAQQPQQTQPAQSWQQPPSQPQHQTYPQQQPMPAAGQQPQFRAPSGGEFRPVDSQPNGAFQPHGQPQNPGQPNRQPQPGNPPANGANFGPPPWFPLPPAKQKRVDDLLRFWQGRSQQVKTYRCKFTRWEYDPVFGPADSSIPLRIAEGEIKYAAPDKGLFQVTSLQELQMPLQPGAVPVWQNQPQQKFEHWVCDGNSIFEFRHIEKHLVETQLPPAMRGKAIADGPLPFLFGANAQQLNARYWIQELDPPLPPPGKPARNEWWLEATPKHAADRANFDRAIIILDATDHMPSGLVLFLPNGQSRTTYDFQDRKVNDWTAQLNEFLRIFIAPKLPAGYKKVVVPWQGDPRAQPGDPANPAPPAENAAERPRGFLPGTR